MNYKKRAGLYLLRKRGSTISLFAFVLIVSIFLISCFGILNASESLSSDIRKSLGGAFYLRASTEVAAYEDGNSEIIKHPVSATDEMIEKILSCGDIAYYNPINYGYARSEELEFIHGNFHSEENNMGQVTSAKYSALIPDFMDETVALTQGEPIRENDANAILVSEELAEMNGLSVGDTITLESAELVESDGEYVDGFQGEHGKAEVTVVGIYTVLSESSGDTLTAGRAENMIYATLDVLVSLNESEESVYTGEVDFYVSDPEDINNIVAEVRQIEEIDWNTNFIRTNDFQYSQVSDGLYSMSELVKTLMVSVAVTSAAVLTLILILRIRGRVHEMGILLAAGIEKKEIVKQILLETLLISVSAIILSFAVSFGISYALENHFFSDFELYLVNADVLNGIVDTVEKDGNYLTVGFRQGVFVLCGQALTIIGTILLALITVMRMKPKEILSKMG